MSIIDEIAKIFGYTKIGKRNEMFDICKCGHEKGDHVNPATMYYGVCMCSDCDCEKFDLDFIPHFTDKAPRYEADLKTAKQKKASGLYLTNTQKRLIRDENK